MRLKTILAAIATAALLFATGCGKGDPTTYAVKISGSLTLSGKTDIHVFEYKDGEKIANHSFEADAKNQKTEHFTAEDGVSKVKIYAAGRYSSDGRWVQRVFPLKKHSETWITIDLNEELLGPNEP